MALPHLRQNYILLQIVHPRYYYLQVGFVVIDEHRQKLEGTLVHFASVGYDIHLQIVDALYQKLQNYFVNAQLLEHVLVPFVIVTVHHEPHVHIFDRLVELPHRLIHQRFV